MMKDLRRTITAEDLERTSPEPLPKIADVIDRIGMGWAQVMVLMVGAGVYFADGAEIMIIAAVTETVGDNWSLTNGSEGEIVSCVFVGVLVGNLMSSVICDTYGRRTAILWSYFGLFLFGMLSAAALGFWSMIFTRLMVGFSFGMGVPAWNTLGAELCPSSWRVYMSTGGSLFFVLGEMYSCVLLAMDDPTLQHLHWRELLIKSSIPPGVFFVFAYMFLLQSPLQLSAFGQHAEARQVLQTMNDWNGSDQAVDYRPAKLRSKKPEDDSQIMDAIKTIFGPKMLFSTLVVSYSLMVVNFIYYGCTYAFPQLLGQLHANGNPVLELLLGCVWESAGLAIAWYVGTSLPRKEALQFWLLSFSIAALFFTVGNSFAGSWSGFLLSELGFCLIKCIPPVGFTVGYLYAVEIYPTSARAVGISFCIAAGRIGAITSPTVFELLTGAFPWQSYFVFSMCLAMLNFFLVPFLPFETAGKQLSSGVDELDGAKGETDSDVNYGALH